MFMWYCITATRNMREISSNCIFREVHTKSSIQFVVCKAIIVFFLNHINNVHNHIASKFTQFSQAISLNHQHALYCNGCLLLMQ